MDTSKIFVISRQKCGTTSTGKFLRDHGFKCLSPDGERNRYWSILAQTGKINEVFDDSVLDDFDAFEDDPWWMHGVPQKLAQRFPESKFILLTRDPEDWFDSIRSHFNEYGGFSMVHAFEYDRHQEYFHYLNSNRSLVRNEFALEIKESHRKHYCEIYTNRLNEIIHYFKSRSLQNQLFVDNLEDSEVWKRLGNFLNIEVNSTYRVHSNRKENRRKNTRKSFAKDFKWILKDYLT